MGIKSFVFVFCVLFCMQVLNASRLHQRSLDESAIANNASAEEVTAKPEKETCVGRQPCGWAVYNKRTRFLDYFMRNRCVCAPGLACIREDDDISITAYVYRCGIEENPTQS